MIRLFRHDGLELMLNVDLIKDIHAGPLTVIILLSGEELRVKNSLTDVLNKIRAYRHGIEGEDREYDPGEKRSDRPRKSQAPSAIQSTVEASPAADSVPDPQEPR